jgi:hypothetical protein
MRRDQLLKGMQFCVVNGTETHGKQQLEIEV